MIAIKRGNAQIVEVLLDFGAELKESDFLERDVETLTDKFLGLRHENRGEIIKLLR